MATTTLPEQFGKFSSTIKGSALACLLLPFMLVVAIAKEAQVLLRLFVCKALLRLGLCFARATTSKKAKQCC